MPKRLLTLLNIRENEARTVLLMLAQYFFLGAAMLFVQSASLALFFTAWDSSAMPYIYLGIALIVSSITALFLKISERTSLARFLVMCLLFLLFGTLALWFALGLTNSKWLLLALPVWSQTLVNISVMAFWTLSGNLFDVRQGKRIFGLMNAGSWLAYVVMGPFTAPLVALLGTENLYLVIAFFLLLGFAFQQATLRENPRTGLAPEPESGMARSSAAVPIWRNRYVLLIFALITLWRVSYFVLDNIFYDRAALQYPSADALAAFIGGFYGLVGGLGFVTDTFLTGRIISRFGLRAGLLATPALTMLFVLLLALTGALDASQIVLLFSFAAAGKFINEGLGFSLDQSASAITYQPLAEKERSRTQTVAEGIVQPLAIGLAGGLLLALNFLFQFDAIQLSYVYLAFGLGWLGVGWALVRAYPQALTQALHRRRFGEKGLNLQDQASLEVVQSSLTSPHPAEVLYALDLLEKSGHAAYLPGLLRLVDAENAEVRASVLPRLEKAHLTEALPGLGALLERESSPEGRESIARTMSFLSKSTGLALLALPDVSTRRGALVGLLRANPPEDLPGDALQLLYALAEADDVAQRLEAARLVRACANPGLFAPLMVLLRDSDLAVRKSALSAAIYTRHPAIYPAVIEALSHPQTRSLAFSALVAGGEAALPEILAQLGEPERLHHRVRLRLVRACAHMRGPAVVDALVSLLAQPGTRLRSRILEALQSNGFRVAAPLEAYIQAELRRCAWLLGSLRDLQPETGAAATCQALEQDLRESLNRLFLLFGFVYDVRRISRAQRAIGQQQAGQAAYAIEVLDSTLSQPHRAAFLPLLEDFSPAERLQKMGAAYAQAGMRPRIRILDVLSNPLARENPWLVATALDCAPRLGIQRAEVQSLGLHQANVTLLARMADWQETETNMLSTVERVLILKTLSIFADTPDEALAELAELVEEVTALPGEVIVQEGEPGQSLFVVVSGTVEVIDDNRVINHLGGRAVFGELSLLDSSPRTATIRALEETRLLRIDQAPFYELMSDYVEVALGTIHMLTRNLRARTGDVLELNRMLKANQ
jgi:ATP:ADP antiporter, AAA family